ncbi:hypothetical protein [Streptomyces sp. NPDC059819]|uniref:hypothetical protein n=1 Tax=Streptomyces sp. NPDC059819 TaxID=3346963 RepID=UPI00364CDF09
MRQGAGTFVTRSLAAPGSEPDSPRRARLAEWMREAAASGLTEQEVSTLFDTVRAHTYAAARTPASPA